MALIWKDRVLETSTTTGTGDFTLEGSVTGYRTFASVCAVSDTVYYYIEAVDGSGAPTGVWETGLGTYSGANTLTRTTVLDSSTGSAVDFAAGAKRVALTNVAAVMSTVVLETLAVACSDETTALTAGTSKVTFRMPYAFTLLAVRASVTGAAAAGTLTIGINEGGASILSTPLTIDATEKTSTTAAAAAVISDGSLADDAEITIDLDDAADGTATGLKVYMTGRRA